MTLPKQCPRCQSPRGYSGEAVKTDHGNATWTLLVCGECGISQWTVEENEEEEEACG